AGRARVPATSPAAARRRRKLETFISGSSFLESKREVDESPRLQAGDDYRAGARGGRSGKSFLEQHDRRSRDGKGQGPAGRRGHVSDEENAFPRVLPEEGDQTGRRGRQRRDGRGAPGQRGLRVSERDQGLVERPERARICLLAGEVDPGVLALGVHVPGATAREAPARVRVPAVRSALAPVVARNAALH